MAQAQGVGIGTPTPASSAALEVQSTSQGLLLPRLTAAQRAAIAAPVAGLTVYQTDGTAGLYYYNGRGWLNATTGVIPDAEGQAVAPPVKGAVSTLAGLAGTSGSTDATGTAARFNTPAALALDGTGNLYVTDRLGYTIRKVTPTGVVTTVAGLAGNSGSTDGTGAAARFLFPQGVAVDAGGNLFVTDASAVGGNNIRKVTPAGAVTTFAGAQGGAAGAYATGNGTAIRFSFVTAPVFDAAGNLYVSDRNNFVIRKITPAGDVSLVAGQVGTSGTADGTGTGARFTAVNCLAIDAGGNLYAGDGSVVRKITPAGVVTTLAGQPGTTSSVDGTGTGASFYRISGMGVDATGLIYAAESITQVIRKITPAGVVTTLAGAAGSSGSTDGTGTATRFNGPSGLAVAGADAVLYVSETGNHTIRVIR